MRQFRPCQMCHNQWIPACSHQSPAQALSDVCCAGAKETAQGPAAFLSPLLLGRTFVSACLHTFGPWPSLMLIPPLSLQGSWSKGAITDSLCLSHQRAPRVKSCCILATPQYLMSLHQHRQSFGLCPQVSMQQGECGAFPLHQGPCPGKMASEMWGTFP